jgi:hypothetical protein
MGWIRYYEDILIDPKLRAIARELDARWITIVGAWSVVLLMARQSPIRGKLMVTVDQPMVMADVSETFHVTLRETEELFQAFVGKGLLGVDEAGAWYVVNWSRRQYESDSSTERVRRCRENARAGNGNETFPKRPQSTETETEAEGKGVLPAPALPGNVSRALQAREFGATGGEGPLDPRDSKVPLLVQYQLLTSRTPSAADRNLSGEIMALSEWNLNIALAAMELIARRAKEDGRPMNALAYFRDGIVEALVSGKMPGGGKRAGRKGFRNAEGGGDTGPVQQRWGR